MQQLRLHQNFPPPLTGAVRSREEENSTFNSLTVIIGAESVTVVGSVTYNIGPPVTVAMDFRLRDNASGKVYWAHNFVMTLSEAAGFTQFEFSGRFYSPDHGYVEISTPTSFLVNTGQDWPSQGEMICTGKDGTKARLRAISATTFVVEADTNGDGSYDWTSGDLNWQ